MMMIEPPRRPPTARYRRVSQVLPALWADATLRRSLRLFRRLKKWTVTLWAARGGYSEDTARRELRALYELGLVVVLAGEAKTTRGAHHGGRTPDVWLLTDLGGHALNALYPKIPNVIRAPKIVLGQPVCAAGGLWKYTKASAHARAQNAHDLDCVRLALHLGMYAKGTQWHIRPVVDFQTATGEGRIVLDFALLYEQQVWEPLQGPIGRAMQTTLLLLELEGSEELAHIQAKHARCFALGSTYYRPRVVERIEPLLLVVLAFPSAKTRQTVIQRHRRAYGGTMESRYGLGFIDLATILAAPPGTLPWEAIETVSHSAEWGKYLRASRRARR